MHVPHRPMLFQNQPMTTGPSYGPYSMSAFPPMMQNMQLGFPTNPINPNHMTAYGTAMDDHLPDHNALRNAKTQAEHIYRSYHPGGGKVTNDNIRASLLNTETFRLDNLPKSADLSKAPEYDSSILTHFPDALTAEFYRVAARPDKPAAARDPTIPQTGGALRAHIVALIHAFNSWEDADDNEGMLKPFKNQTRDQKLVECMCWGLLKACIDRSRADAPLMQAWDEAKAKNAGNIGTFAERFDDIVYAMTKSKTICKHLFDAPYSAVFIDDPSRAVSRVKANRDLNKMKAEQMSVGKRIRDEEAQKNGDYTPSKRSKTPGRLNRSTPREPRTPTGPSTPTSSRYDTPGSYLRDGTPINGSSHSPSDIMQSPSTRRSLRQTRRPESYAPALPDEPSPTPDGELHPDEDGQVEISGESDVLNNGHSGRMSDTDVKSESHLMTPQMGYNQAMMTPDQRAYMQQMQQMQQMMYGGHVGNDLMPSGMNQNMHNAFYGVGRYDGPSSRGGYNSFARGPYRGSTSRHGMMRPQGMGHGASQQNNMVPNTSHAQQWAVGGYNQNYSPSFDFGGQPEELQGPGVFTGVNAVNGAENHAQQEHGSDAAHDGFAGNGDGADTGSGHSS
jgi:hypothetical protein